MRILNNVNIAATSITQNKQVNEKLNKNTEAKQSVPNPVELTISEEAQEYYRNSISQNGQKESYDSVMERREKLKSEKVSFMDYGYEMSKRAEQLSKECANPEKSITGTVDKANGYIKAYAQMYDEIVQGYENGTREIYVADENGTHKMTKDEELSALDKAYTSKVDDFVTREKTNQQAREIITEEMQKVAKLSSGSTSANAFLEEQKRRGTDEIPANLNEKMNQAVIAFKEKYQMFHPATDKLSQMLTGLQIS